MFPPFTSPNQFYPGLIVWCDPNCYEMDVSTLAPNELYDRKKARQLHPCLVVAVDYNNNSLQVARICATTPTDTRRWVRVDSPPGITWRLSDAWIWVGTPPTVAMILNNGKAMHPHKDTKYTSSPVAAANLQNYWVHRQNYISWRQMRADNAPSTSASANTHYGQHQNTLYSTPSHGRGMYPKPDAEPIIPPTSGGIQHPLTAPRRRAAGVHRDTPERAGLVAQPGDGVVLARQSRAFAADRAEVVSRALCVGTGVQTGSLAQVWEDDRTESVE
ncbi:hypothetical protein C8R47DRAFT_1147825 [Mycena vitilis]|nr:hypothetical protein C8R47DRAFT_1147825 [Mycena vitilis]